MYKCPCFPPSLSSPPSHHLLHMSHHSPSTPPPPLSSIFTIKQELPEKWNNVKKQSAVMKQTVAPLQAEEVNRIRRELVSFDVRQHEFREEFRKTAPFNFKSTLPYVRIDNVSSLSGHGSIADSTMHGILVCRWYLQ